MTKIIEETPLAETLEETIASDANLTDGQSTEDDAKTPETQSLHDDASDEEEGDETFIVDATAEKDPDDAEDEKKPAPPWVKKVRDINRNVTKENLQLKRQIKELSAKLKPEKIQGPGPKPTLEKCDYDEDVYVQQIDRWHQQNAAFKAQQEAEQKEIQQQQQQQQQAIEKYQTRRQTLNLKDFAEAEQIVSQTLSPQQQQIILDGAEDAAVVVYALGKNPTKLAQLATTSNYAKFATEVGKLETSLKVSKRKRLKPETRVKGSANTSGAITSELARLRKEAEQTGDYSKVAAFNRQQRQARAT